MDLRLCVMLYWLYLLMTVNVYKQVSIVDIIYCDGAFMKVRCRENTKIYIFIKSR